MWLVKMPPCSWAVSKVTVLTLLFLSLKNCNAVKSGTQIFAYTGSLQSYTVPSGAQSVTVALWGAGGAGMGINPTWMPGSARSVFAGGSGGYTSCELSVTSGQQLYVLVGGGG